MPNLQDQAKTVLQNNWKDGFTIPCEGLYPFQWNWDSGFIALGWAHFNMEHAHQEVRSLLKGQWKNGFLPHIVFHNDSDTYFPGPEVHAAHLSPFSPSTKTSGITQPPVLGFILERIFEIDSNKERARAFVEEVYDQVFQNHEYFYQNRDPQKEGLVYICHNWEAGTDNTPVWDFIWETFSVPEYSFQRRDTALIDAAHRPTNKEYQYYIHLIELFKQWKYDDKAIAEKSPFLVQDPLFNSMLIASNRSLIRLGTEIGKTEKVSQLEVWNTKAVKAMQDKLYHNELKGYVYYDLRNERYLPYLSSSSFTPLFAMIPDHGTAEAMVEHFKGGRFSGPNDENYLCASFDPSSPFFNPEKYWRGPIWINLNWLIYKGLQNYGMHDLADRIKEDTLFFMNKYGFYEYFDPSKERHKTLEKGYGGNNFSWSAALTIDLLTNESNL